MSPHSEVKTSASIATGCRGHLSIQRICMRPCLIARTVRSRRVPRLRTSPRTIPHHALTTTSKMPSNFGDAEQREHDPAAHEQRFDQEKIVQRNPHPDFKQVESSRPDWPNHSDWQFTKTKQPDWKLGQGANDGGECLKKDHVEIDPYEEGRPAISNYKLLISGIIPRPIGFICTRSKDGKNPTWMAQWEI